MSHTDKADNPATPSAQTAPEKAPWRFSFTPDSPYVTEQELCAFVKLHPRTIERWRKGGYLPEAVNLAGKWRWPPVSISHWRYCVETRRRDPLAFPILMTEPDCVLFDADGKFITNTSPKTDEVTNG